VEALLGKLKMRGMILKEIPKFVDEAKVPDGLNINKLLLSVLWDRTREITDRVPQ
jgi:hypothetical protein